MIVSAPPSIYPQLEIEAFIKKEKQEGLQNIFITTVTDSLNHLKEIGLTINELCKKIINFLFIPLQERFFVV